MSQLKPRNALVPYGVISTITQGNPMSTKHLGSPPRQKQRLSGASPRLVGAERAYWLINNHYTQIFGNFIQFETTRSMRAKIIELEESLLTLRRGDGAYIQMARTIFSYERICELLEMMPSRR